MTFRSLVLTTVFAAVALPGLAFAYDSDAAADVYSRPRPDYDARGVRLGSFVLFPTLTAGVGYEDNVFNVSDTLTPKEDFELFVSPAFKLNSDWGRHQLNIRAESKSYFYQSFSSEDYTDWAVAADARIDIVSGTDLSFRAGYRDEHETRGTVEADFSFDRTEYTRWDAGASLNHVGNFFRGSVGFDYSQTDYDDASSRTTLPAYVTTPICPSGTAVPTAVGISFRTCNNDDRDLRDLSAFLKLGLAISPGYAVFVRGVYNDRDFTGKNPWNFGGGQPVNLEVDDANYNRDSSGWEGHLGVDFELSRLLTGEAYVGYEEQEFDDHPYAPLATTRKLPSIDGFTFGADLKWFPTMLTTVSFDAKREIKSNPFVEGLLTSGSGITSDRFDLRVDHELMRNVVLFAKVGYGQDDYEGTSTRQDDIIKGGVGALFLINNNFHLTASYDFVDRDSNVSNLDYQNNMFLLSVTGKL